MWLLCVCLLLLFCAGARAGDSGVLAANLVADTGGGDTAWANDDSPTCDDSTASLSAFCNVAPGAVAALLPRWPR